MVGGGSHPSPRGVLPLGGRVGRVWNLRAIPGEGTTQGHVIEAAKWLLGNGSLFHSLPAQTSSLQSLRGGILHRPTLLRLNALESISWMSSAPAGTEFVRTAMPGPPMTAAR